MTSTMPSLEAFLAGSDPVAVVEVAGTRGSTPREKGAFMLVSHAATQGTIGGGQLEYMAIDKARQMLKRRPVARPAGASIRIEVDEVCATLDIPLGPEIGQCCGGRVEVLIRPVDAALAAELLRSTQAEETHAPHIYIFGGGHVGHALATAIALLPVHVTVVDSRADALEGMPPDIETRLTPVPEEMVAQAPGGTAFVILTHDHALDFLIATEALKRTDAAYVGMIGSKTKKATFRSWFLKDGGGNQAQFARLVSPIGGAAVKDKRPPVIAALAAAEIMTALSVFSGSAVRERQKAG